jgi:hypothetical protein
MDGCPVEIPKRIIQLGKLIEPFCSRMPGTTLYEQYVSTPTSGTETALENSPRDHNSRLSAS